MSGEMKFHPIANLFPMIEGDDFDALVDDIKQNGLLDPIWTYEGKILDGRNRYMACLAAEVEPKYKEYKHDNPYVFVVSMNIQRRHLTPSQRACVAVELMPYYKQAAKERMSAGGGDKKSGKQKIADPIEGKGSARDFAAEAAKVNYQYVSDAQLVLKESPTLFDEMKAGLIHMKEALSQVKKDKKQKARAELVELANKQEAETYSQFKTNGVYVADITSIDFPENSIDMIFTDPPYHDEYLSLYKALTDFADRTLKPGAYVMAYCGKMFLPEVMKMLGEKLEYVWLFGVFQPDNNTKISKHHLFEAWRPIVCFKKPGKTNTREWQPDMIKGTRDKSFHEWQQQIEPPTKYIEAYTLPGELVVDPFLGGGTTIMACKKLSRSYIGFDKDPEAVKLTKLRLSGNDNL